MQNKKLTELIEAGRVVVTGKYYDGASDEINYTDRTTGKPATIKQIKLTVGLNTTRGRKIVTAVMRVPEGGDPKAILAALNLEEGETIVMEVDSLTKVAPSTKGAESTWMLRINGAYPAREEPADEKPAGEKPAGKKPAGKKPVGKKPAGGKSDVAA